MLTSSPVLADQVKTDCVTLECDILNQSRHSDWRCYCSVKAIDGDGQGGVIIVAGAYWVTWQPAAVMTRR